jgi:hypothetical protein
MDLLAYAKSIANHVETAATEAADSVVVFRQR